MTRHDGTQAEPLAISERQLDAMTADLEEAHQATLPVMHQAVADWHERLRRENSPDQLAEMRARIQRPSRRGFLIGAGATLGGLVLAACSSDDDNSTSSGSSTSNPKAAVNAKVTDVAGLAKLARALEDSAAATYLSVIPVVSDPGGIKTVATIQPVEMQHAAILNFVLGQYPVPNAFAKTDGARTLSDEMG